VKPRITKIVKGWWNKQTSPWSMTIYDSHFNRQKVKANYLYVEKDGKRLLLLAADSPFKFPAAVEIQSKYGFKRLMYLEDVPNPLLNPFCPYVSKLYYYLLVNLDGDIYEQEPKLINEQEYKLLAEGSNYVDIP